MGDRPGWSRLSEMSSGAFEDRSEGLPRVLRGLLLALVGGGVALAIAAAAGVLHTSSHTTVIEQLPTKTTPSSLSGPWSSIYAQSAAGIVELTVQATTTVSTPFGEREESETVEGTGIVLDGRGDILTADHVVTGATSVTVTFSDGVKRSAKVLGQDRSTDAAVVQVSPSGLTLHPLGLGSTRELAVGDPIAVVGDALGFEDSMSTGIVSGLDRTIEAPNGFTIAHAIQTDAAMNPGNSGGPLLDAQGEVVGIADQIATGTGRFGSSSNTSTGVGFAVPIDLIKSELSALEHDQTVAHAYLGVETAASSSGQAGALVAKVLSGTPAAKAGLRAGDLITAFDGASVASVGDLIALLAEAHPGERVALTILRNGRTVTLTVTLGTQPAHAPSQ